MAFTTCFDDLPDLFFIELFEYLSSVDILWSFINLNHRLQSLISERGFLRFINLSSARFFQFETLLSLLPLNRIETLVIDIEAIPLQVPCWPCLPRLTTLRLYGLRDYDDGSRFILRYSQSLEHLTVETNDFFISVGSTAYRRKMHPKVFLENMLPRLSALQSLDLGQDTGTGYPVWDVSTIQAALRCLRVPLQDITQLCDLLSIKTLSTTLEQLHVAMRSHVMGSSNELTTEWTLPQMISLHTLSFVQSIFSDNTIKWATIECLTAPNVMPRLRQMKLVLFISVDDLDPIKRSALFTDDRRVDVQFAFILRDPSFGSQLNKHMPHGSRFHPRPIVLATCVLSWLNPKYRRLINYHCYFDNFPLAYDVWYTLPWAFDQVFDLPDPCRSIIKVETFVPSIGSSSIVGPSRLRTLHVSQSGSLPSIASMPHVVQLDRVKTVHLSYYDWPSDLKLQSVRHVTLTNSLAALRNFASFPTGIRSLRILINAAFMPNAETSNWSILRSLSALPKLTSLHINLKNVKTGLDESSCQIIAETVPIVVHFGIYFRTRWGIPRPRDVPVFDNANAFRLDILAANAGFIIEDDDDPYNVSITESVVNEYRKSIEGIRCRISRLSFHTKPLVVVEEGGCGLTVWS